MKMRSVLWIRIAKTGYIIMSVIFCIVGIIFIMSPEISALTLGRVLGIAMVVFGCIKLIGYFSKDLFRLAFQYDLQFGALMVVLGLITLLKTDKVMSFIFVTVGIAVLVDSMFKIQIAIDSRKFGIRYWWSILVLSIVTGLIALGMIFSPWESAKVIVAILGVSLFAEGLLNFCVAVNTVKIIENQHPDVITEDWFNG